MKMQASIIASEQPDTLLSTLATRSLADMITASMQIAHEANAIKQEYREARIVTQKGIQEGFKNSVGCAIAYTRHFVEH